MGDKILTCSFLFSRTLATSVSLLSTAVNDINFVDFNEKERVRDIRFVDFNEKERVCDVRFVKFNEKERVSDVIFGENARGKVFFVVALPNFGLVTSYLGNRGRIFA